jgi:uncharacterized membrane protein
MDPQAPSVPLVQPDELSVREKEDAMGAWLMAFGALHLGLPVPFLGLVAAWIYHVVNAKKSQFTGFHCFQSFLFSVPASVLSAVWVVWGGFLVVWLLRGTGSPPPGGPYFWPFSLVCLAAYIVYLIGCGVGAYRARKGRVIYFPWIGRWAYARYLGPGRKAPRPSQPNLPPAGL